MRPSDRAMALFERVWGSFLGRCVQRFIAMTGIDRCLMLSSQAFTALIPLLILVSALAPTDREDVVSDSVIRRFGLEGDSAAAVKQLFDIPEGATGSLSVFSFLLLVASGTSFARRLTRTCGSTGHNMRLNAPQHAAQRATTCGSTGGGGWTVVRWGA